MSFWVCHGCLWHICFRALPQKCFLLRILSKMLPLMMPRHLPIPLCKHMPSMTFEQFVSTGLSLFGRFQPRHPLQRSPQHLDKLSIECFEQWHVKIFSCDCSFSVHYKAAKDIKKPHFSTRCQRCLVTLQWSTMCSSNAAMIVACQYWSKHTTRCFFSGRIPSWWFAICGAASMCGTWSVLAFMWAIDLNLNLLNSSHMVSVVCLPIFQGFCCAEPGWNTHTSSH